MSKRDAPNALMDWLGWRKPDLTRARPIGGLIGMLILLVSAVVLVMALIALFRALGALAFGRQEALSFGSGAIFAAIFGAPLVIWRTLIAQRQNRIEQEGLITDRINAAVLGLGAEKEVNEHLTDTDGTPLFKDDDPRQPVIIQTTKPNLEVRIGAILSLERLARNNLDVHVQIMEVLCAYIRQNAPASSAKPGPELIAGPEGLDEEERREEDGGELAPVKAWANVRERNRDIISKWKATLPPIRSDIMTVLEVIQRRSEDQRKLEATHRDPDAPYPFDPPCPEFSDSTDPAAYWDKASEWRQTLLTRLDAGYRPDLRGINLQGADLSRFDLRGLRLNNVQMQGADLGGAEIQGAVLVRAQMQGADLGGAKMQGAVLWGAEMQGADLGGAEMQGADLGGAKMQGADLWGTVLDDLVEFREAVLRGAGLGSVDDATIVILRPFWNDIFADGSVPVALNDPDRPDHWPTEKLDYDDFNRQWRAWQATLPPGWER